MLKRSLLVRHELRCPVHRNTVRAAGLRREDAEQLARSDGHGVSQIRTGLLRARVVSYDCAGYRSGTRGAIDPNREGVVIAGVPDVTSRPHVELRDRASNGDRLLHVSLRSVVIVEQANEKVALAILQV